MCLISLDVLSHVVFCSVYRNLKGEIPMHKLSCYYCKGNAVDKFSNLGLCNRNSSMVIDAVSSLTSVDDCKRRDCTCSLLIPDKFGLV